MNRRNFLSSLVAFAAMPLIGWAPVRPPVVHFSNDIEHLVQQTLKELGEARWVDIVSDLQRHVSKAMLLRERRAVLAFTGPDEIGMLRVPG